MIYGLAEKLKTSRISMGLKQSVVASKLGISPSIVSSYETGERTPSVKVLLQFADLYRCSVDYLLGKTSLHSINTEGLTPEQINILNMLINNFIMSNEKKR